MKWNAVIILAFGFAHLAGAKHVVDMDEDQDHHRLRGLVDLLDRVPGHPPRKLQDTCDPAQAVTTQGAEDGSTDSFGRLCMEEYPTSQNYGCTANDVRIAGVSIKQLRDANGNVIDPVNGAYECSEGELLSVDFTATVLNGAKSERLDSSVFWTDGPDARTGTTDPDGVQLTSCSYTSFTAVGSPGGNVVNPDGLPNLEKPAVDDNCGDMPGQITDYADICGLKIVCQDLSGGNDLQVRVASCTTYKIPGANTVCSNTNPETFLPGSPSKCKCEFTTFPITIKNPPTITKTCAASDPAIFLDSGVRKVQWTVTVSITNNNVGSALDNWAVTDSPLSFDEALTSASEGAILAGETKMYTRTITVVLPSTFDYNLGFNDTLTLSSTDGSFDDVSSEPATCPKICEFTATCTLQDESNNCVAPPALTNPVDVFDIGPLPCGPLVLSSSDAGAVCGGEINRTYTLLEDLNGNGAFDTGEETATCVQTITIVDEPPTVIAPPNKELQCPANTTTDNTGVGSATDDCETLTPTAEPDAVVPNCGGTVTITRTWSVTDKCGQTGSADQTITTIDTEPPAINCPANGSFDCTSNLGVAPDIEDAVDACEGDITPVYNGCCFDTVGGLTLDRKWTATDGCGNPASCTQENPLSPTCPTLI